MPISKSTGTVAGQANVSILTLQQYSLRAALTLPGRRVLTPTQRSSSGTTRTLYFAEDHGLNVGDLFLVGGFTNAAYNESTSNTLGAVSAVSLPNRLSYTRTSTLNEATVDVTAGSLIALGFRNLRVAVRFAIPCNANFVAQDRLWGFGLSQGANPVGATNCLYWGGYGTRPGTATYSDATKSVSISQGTNYPYIYKVGATWNAAGLQFNPGLGADRSRPQIWAIDWRRYDGSSSYGTLTVARCPDADLTREDMLYFLRSQVALASGGSVSIGGRSYYSLIYFHTTEYAPLTYAGGGVPYVEVFACDPAFPAEVYDIGYSIW